MPRSVDLQSGHLLPAKIWSGSNAGTQDHRYRKRLLNKINNFIIITIYKGMLIDFTVFDIPDILEMLENPSELEERIKEALDLLKEQG